MVASGDIPAYNMLSGQATNSPTLETAETDAMNLQNGLQGYWRFDNPKVSRGYSLKFDGIDDGVDFGGPMPDNQDFTFAAWFKMDDSDGGQIIGANAPCWTGANLVGTSGNISFGIRQGSGGNCPAYTTYPVSIGEWHHATGVANASTGEIKLYLDGQLVDSDTGWNGTIVGGLDKIGIDEFSGPEQAFKGGLDNIRVYNRTLTASEVSKIYEEKSVSKKGLRRFYQLNKGPEKCDLTSGNSCIADSSDNGYSATPTNFDDNNLDTGSGWIKETPLNRPSVKDYSINGHTGTFHGGSNGQLKNFDFNASNGWTKGKIGEHAVEFGGKNSGTHVTLGNVSKLNPEKITISAWVKPNEGLNDYYYNYIYSNSRDCCGSRYKGVDFRIGDGNLIFKIWNGSNAASVSGGSFSADNWHHVTATYDGSKLKIYIDGDHIATESSSLGIGQPATYNTYIGAMGHGPSSYIFNGTIGDVKLYNVALTTPEIESIYSGELITKDLVGRWNFEAGDRETAYDTSSFGRTGILGTETLDLDGESQKISTQKFTKLNQSFTFSTWLNPETRRASTVLSQAEFNSIKYSQDINTSYSAWSNYCGHGVTHTGLKAPDGSNTATSIQVSYGDSYCEIARGRIQYNNPKIGKKYTVSIWAKGKDGGEEFRLGIDDYNLCTYTLSQEWERYSCTKTKDSDQQSRGLEFFGMDSNTTYYVWGAQRRPGTYTGIYSRTTDNSVNSTGVNIWTEDELLVYEYRTSENSVTLEAQAPTENWRHITAKRTGQKIQLYTEGELRAQEDIAATFQNDKRPTIAGTIDENITTFQGKLDELRTYNRSLSEKEVRRLAFQ